MLTWSSRPVLPAEALGMRAGLLGSGAAAASLLVAGNLFPISEPQLPPLGSVELIEMTRWKGPAWCLGVLEAWGR